MRNTLLPLITLFASAVILYLGIGLMNILVPSRMGLEGMSTDTIGMVLSMFFVGLFAGAIYSKQLVKRVGHIRALAGSVAIEAICILAFTLDTSPLLWGVLRVLLGFSHACLLTAMESWLSDSASEENRGKVLAVYNACILGGLFGGQFLMGVAEPSDNTLFIIVGMLFCMAALPILFSRVQGPVIETIAPMSVISLFKTSPLGVATCLTAGAVYSALFNMLPVFAAEYHINGFQLSLFMGCAIIGAFTLQFPVGLLSDRFDRRSILFVLLLLSSVLGIAVIPLAEREMTIGIFIVNGIAAGIITCYYPLSVAESFDKLKKSEMVSAMGSLLLAFGIGGAIGPYAASVVMQVFGSSSLFYFLAILQILLALFTLYRMTVSKALPVSDQEDFVMQNAALSTSVNLDPRTEYTEPDAIPSSAAKTAVLIAESDPAAAVKMARALTLNNPEKGTEVAAAVASVPGIDVMRLYEVMKETAPYQILEITQAIVKAKPELAPELISQLAEWYPQQVIAVAIEVGRVFPDMRIEMARIAVASAPESATQVAEYYSGLLAEEREAIRPADREEDTSESDVMNIASELWDANPDQALDIAVTVAESFPDAAVPMTEEYMVNYEQDTDESSVSLDKGEAEPGEYSDAVEWVSRMSEAAPDQALDIAVAVAESVPETAVPMTEDYMAHYEPEGTEDESLKGDVSAEAVGDGEHPAAVEWVSRLSEAAPDQALDIAVAVAESVPETAVPMTEEFMSQYEQDSVEGSMSAESNLSEMDSEEYSDAVEWVSRLSEAAPDQAMDVAATVVEAAPESMLEVTEEYLSVSEEDQEVADEINEVSNLSEEETEVEDEEHQKAVEWLTRMSELSPEMSLNLAVKIVEAVPESAGYVAAEVSRLLHESHNEESSGIVEEPASEIEEAVEVVNRLSEAAPDNIEDVAIAVVGNIPDAASEVVDAISDGSEAREGEWVESIDKNS
ncbi:MFS transporter [Amphritea japonica]|uniref:MFS transporter n=1 Tax=Amphritea japonica ATCC BAA-1530 TaxID=1278309 RepID=A0A7R6SSF1_9GAMM|nr:MFS transporter [Amphritea japonica]BBB26185.1 MFS transporter [Amphritea japonica ATCC BAA-1530]